MRLNLFSPQGILRRMLQKKKGKYKKAKSAASILVTPKWLISFLWYMSYRAFYFFVACQGLYIVDFVYQSVFFRVTRFKRQINDG